MYINVGANIDGKPVRTKKALKQAVKDGDSVRFYSTALLGESFYGGVSDIPQGAKLSVVGPDPFTSRKWYATVSNGKVT